MQKLAVVEGQGPRQSLHQPRPNAETATSENIARPGNTAETDKWRTKFDHHEWQDSDMKSPNQFDDIRLRCFYANADSIVEEITLDIE